MSVPTNTLKSLIVSVRSTCKSDQYVALFTTLALPDICAAIEHGKTSGQRYSEWWETYAKDYVGFMSGDDCYALRCATLHEGKVDVSDQRKKDVLDYYIFGDFDSHCNVFRDCEIMGENHSFLQLSVPRFCEEVCTYVEDWMKDMSTNLDVMRRMDEGIIIHEKGYNHLGAIRFM